MKDVKAYGPFKTSPEQLQELKGPAGCSLDGEPQTTAGATAPWNKRHYPGQLFVTSEEPSHHSTRSLSLGSTP